ncbi:MAG TPA: AraC family transcriptional regulator [Kofleriaceae bacterium]|nr:AraC family transcriptional regulator [Kofleriaceae bacterium]
MLAEIATADGHISDGTDLCFYRFSRPTTIRKAATFGVTLGVVLQGQKKLRFGQHDEILVDPTRLVVVTRETEHLSLAIAASERRPYLGMSVCFAPDRVARALLALADAGGPAVRESVPAFVMPSDASIADALERLARSLKDPLDRKLLAPLVIDELLFRLLRSDSAAAIRSGVARTPDAHRILESMRFIREQHSRKLTIGELAKRAAMSPSHYAHRFTTVALMSPMRFVREVRLERARALLVERRARANEVAADVGFESAAHFTREFKRRYGVPPSHLLRPRSG